MPSSEAGECEDNPDEDPIPGLRRHRVVYSEVYSPEHDEISISTISFYHKTAAELEVLRPRLQKCLVIKNLEPEEIEVILMAMHSRVTKSHEIVMKQGEDGNSFYIIECGVFEAYTTVNKVETLTATYRHSGVLGELALLHSQPRLETIISVTEGKLWGLERQVFKRIILKSAYQKRQLYERFVESVPMLQPLNSQEKVIVADALISMTFNDGEVIIKQGQEGNGMYFVEKGSVKVMTYDTKAKQVNVVGPGGYFGELALILKKPRAATVLAVGKVKVAFLDIHAFERLLGPCMDVMKRRLSLYERQISMLFGSEEAASLNART